MLPRARIASDGLGRVIRCGADMPPIDGVSGKPGVGGPVIAAKPSGSSPELPSKKVVTAFETAAREGGAEKAPGAAAAACAAGHGRSCSGLPFPWGSDERCVGKEGVRTCRYRWSACH